MKHLTPDELRALLLAQKTIHGSWADLAKAMKCDRSNLYEAGRGQRAMPRKAAKYLGYVRVTAYVRKEK